MKLEIKVYDLNGTQKTVVSPSLTYLTTTNPLEDINLVTVADYTFIVNKTITVSKSGTTSAVRPAEAIFYVKNGQYLTTYKIDIDGVNKGHVRARYTMNNGTVYIIDPMLLKKPLILNDAIEFNGGIGNYYAREKDKNRHDKPT